MRAIIGSLAVLIALLVGLAFAYYFGYQLVYNQSTSEPKGLYLKYPRGPLDISRGETVFFAPTPELLAHMKARYYITPETTFLLKTVLATDGIVCRDQSTITVSSRQLFIKQFDSSGRPLVSNFADHQCKAISNTVFLFGSNDVTNSFDSRYFGTVEKTTLSGAKALWIWD